jgi:hypothetical protein
MEEKFNVKEFIIFIQAICFEMVTTNVLEKQYLISKKQFDIYFVFSVFLNVFKL